LIGSTDTLIQALIAGHVNEKVLRRSIRARTANQRLY
jgi:hypothetical protein